MEKPNIEFEWSDDKAARNLVKHGVNFDDPYAYVYEDELHSDDEPREVLIGYSARNRLLVVSFIQRVFNKIRIITARLASRREQRIYEETPRF